MITKLGELRRAIKDEGVVLWTAVEWTQMINELKDYVYLLQYRPYVRQLEAALKEVGQGHRDNDAQVASTLRLMMGIAAQKAGDLGNSGIWLQEAWHVAGTVQANGSRLWIEAQIFNAWAKKQTQEPWGNLDSHALRMRLKQSAHIAYTAAVRNRILETRYDEAAQLWRAAYNHQLIGEIQTAIRLSDQHSLIASDLRDPIQQANELLPALYSNIAAGAPSDQVGEQIDAAARLYIEAGAHTAILHVLLTMGMSDFGHRERRRQAILCILAAAMGMSGSGYGGVVEGGAEALNIGGIHTPLATHLFEWGMTSLPAIVANNRGKESSSASKANEAFARLQQIRMDDATAATVAECVPMLSDLWNEVVLPGDEVGNDVAAEEVNPRIAALSQSAPTRIPRLWEAVKERKKEIEPSVMRKVAREPLVILHISDPQFGQANIYHGSRSKWEFTIPSSTKFRQAHLVHEQMANHINSQFPLLGIGKIHYVVLTGDIANRGLKSEYRLASEFLRMLRGTLSRFNGAEFPKNHLIMCPGNHDVTYPKLTGMKYKKARGLLFPQSGFEPQYESKFDNYADFWSDWYGKPYPRHNHFTVAHLPEDRVSFFSFNSCELENRKQHFGFVSDQRVKHALAGIRPGYFNIGLVHHNVTPIAETLDDPQVQVSSADYLRSPHFVQLLEDHAVQMVMHGHTHMSLAPFPHYARDGSSVLVTGAGTVSVMRNQRPGGDSQLPCSFNTLILDRSTIAGSMIFRRHDFKQIEDRPEGWEATDAQPFPLYGWR